MASLTKLHLDENQLGYLPDSFGDLRSLEWLDVSQNLIHELPKSFCRLTNLWYFQFSKNSLENLPEDFGNLSNLVELRLDQNNITALPESFAKLQNIETVDLFRNKLTEIPKVLLKLKKLRRLDLDGNRLKIKEDKVPKMTTPVQYAPRDPSLKGTWRGKIREDKQDYAFSTDVQTQQSITHLLEKAELEGKPDEDEDVEEECNYSERLLELAMKRGLSIWKSHTGPETREGDRETHRRSSQEESFKFVPHIETPASDIFEDATDQNNSVDSSVESPEDHQLVSDDWDREVEEIWQQKYQTKGLRITNTSDIPIREQLQDILYSYPPAKQAFTGSATYESIYRKCIPGYNRNNIRMNATVVDETGQFDDADDD